MHRSALLRGTFVVFSGVLHMTIADKALAQADTLERADKLPAPAVVNARLDSLEQIALTSNNPEARSAAVLAISAPGRWWQRTQDDQKTPPTAVRYPGIVARLARIYRQSDDYGVRYSIISLMMPQAERAEAVSFLEEVVEEPGPDPVQPRPGAAVVANDAVFPLAYEAVGALTRMGPQGRAALQRLYVSGTVREPMARALLEKLARQGFERP